MVRTVEDSHVEVKSLVLDKLQMLLFRQTANEMLFAFSVELPTLLSDLCEVWFFFHF
jgi:hypothetical protein